MTETRSGHCLCGAVRITVTDPPQELGACHCGMCRRWTGSAFVTLDVPADRIHVEGAEHIRAFASSDWASRSFCGTCGSTLWYRMTDAPPGHDHYYMAAGLLDDLSGLRLTREIYVDRKPDAFAFAGPTEQVTEAEFLAALNADPEE